MEKWTWARQIQEGKTRSIGARGPGHSQKWGNEGRQPTCATVLVFLVLPMQDQGKCHQQDDDQAGECHHQQEPPLLVERGVHLS